MARAQLAFCHRRIGARYELPTIQIRYRCRRADS